MESIVVARSLLRCCASVFGSLKPSRLKPASAGAAFALALVSTFATGSAHATTAVGAIRGGAGVTATGAATYSIPIQISPGTDGMQPSLALVYDSQSSDGWAGYGWTLSGFSAFTRCPSNPEDDGVDGVMNNVPIRYTSSDDLCLDGQKLRLVSGTWAANGSTYGTQIEGFSVITAHTDGSATGGVSWFTVQTKDGRVYEYGNTTDSKIYAVTDSGTTTVVRVWALDKVTDASGDNPLTCTSTCGNSMAYTYGSSPTVGREYYPLSIKYTANGSTAPDHEVDFTFANRPWGIVTHYSNGMFYRNATRLTTIVSKYNGTAVYTYNLGYESSAPANNRNRLISVQECGADGSCLPATNISWTTDYAGWDTDTSSGISVKTSTLAQSAHLMDVDGDGVADLVYPSDTVANGGTGDWMVAFGKPTGGFNSPVDTGIAVFGETQYALAMDYNGDGRADLLVPLPPGQGWWLFQATGSRAAGAGNIFRTPGNSLPDMSGNNTVTGEPIYEGNVWLADFSGGDLSDMFYNPGSSIQWLQNSGPPNETFSTPTSVYSTGSFKVDIDPDFIDVGLDFDGSGRVGVLVYNTGSDTWIGLNPSGERLMSFDSIAGGDGNAAVPFDANGDGATDLLTAATSGNWQISLSEGTAFNTLSTSVAASSSGDPDPLVVDYYGDGTQVAFVYNDNISGWDMLDAAYSLSTGNFSASVTQGVASPYNSTILSGSLRVGSIESKGMDDLVYSVLGGGVYTWHYRLHQGTGQAYPDRVSQVMNGLGNYSAFVYSTLSDGTSFTRGSYISYPVHSVQTPMPVVSTYTQSDGLGGSYTFTYTYTDARVDTQGHGFLGFASRTITDGRNNNIENLTYDQMFPYTGMVLTDQLEDSSGNTIREVVHSSPDGLPINPGPDGTQRYFPIFDSNSVTDSDKVGSVVTTTRTATTNLSPGINFDSYGDITSQSTITHDYTQGYALYDTLQTIAYATATSTNCVALPSSDAITNTVPSGSLSVPFTDPATRTATYGTDTGHCRPTTQTVTDGTNSLETAYSYDAYGNVSETDVSGTGLPSTRTTTYSYTGGNNEFLTKVTYNPTATTSFSTQATWRYDLGVKSSDIDPNGHTTSYSYDGFGRLTQITHPDNSESLQTYSVCPGGPYCPATAAYVVTDAAEASGSTTPLTTGYTAYDSLGRVVEQGRVLLGGEMSMTDSAYDQFGHVTTVRTPYMMVSGNPSTTTSTTYTYDPARGRITEVSAPQDGSDNCAGSAPTPCNNNTSYSYSGFTVTASHSVTDSASSSATQVTQTIKDALGQTLEVVDSNSGTTLYNYDAFGDLIATQDADNKLTTITYDGLGHKTNMTDPNLGYWTYTSDVLGEVLCQVDAKGQSMLFGYDNLGRITSKVEGMADSEGDCATSGTTSNWTYDGSGGNGLPASVTNNADFTRAYDYDGSGRVADVTTTISGDPHSPYTVSTTYDTLGRIQTITYPVSQTPTGGGSTPTASAIATPTTLILGSGSVTLDGSGSTDPNGLGLQYQWSQTSSLPTLPMDAFDPAAESPTFTPSAAGVYSFQLQVIDSGSAESAPASVSVTVKPTVPLGLSVISQNPSTSGSVTLQWTANATPADSYNVYQSTDDVTFTQVQNVPESGTGTDTATVSGFSNGTYYFEVTAVSNSVEGNKSSAVTEAVTLPPGAPTGMTVSPTDQTPSTNYTVSWTAPASGTVTQYELLEANNSSFTGATTYTITAPTHSKTRSEASVGTYYYKVQACNGTASGACGSYSGTGSVVVMKLPAAPNFSGSPSTINAGGSATLSWSDPGYTVTSWVLQGTSYSASTTSKSVSPPVTKTYSLYACNQVGCGNTSTYTITVNQGSGFVAPPNPGSLDSMSMLADVEPAAGAGDNFTPMAYADDVPVSGLKQVRAPEAKAAPAVTDALQALRQVRQDLVATQPLQPSEAALQARFEKLAGSVPQSLTLAKPGENRPLPEIGRPKYAPPVYAAYAGAKPQVAGGNPYRFVVQYNYDPSSGALESVSNGDTGFIYWRAATDDGVAPVDAFGHVVAYVDGNNVSTVTAYDPATGAITGIGTGVGGSSAVQQLAYSWDGFGNLKQRCDANRGLTESFTYDALNRIASSNVYSGGSPGACVAGSTTVATLDITRYDNVGNIEGRTNSGITSAGQGLNQTYNYADPAHPYAVTSLTDNNTSATVGSYAYDANGNMYCRDTAGTGCTGTGPTPNITWNTDNLPTSITQGGNSSTFSYSPDLQRYQQSETYGGNDITTTYVGSQFEVVTASGDTQYRHNIVADGGVVAVHTIDLSGAATTTYMHSDHLGSSDVLTDDTGTIAVDPVTGQQQVMSFDAFGLRRNPADWSYNLASISMPGLKAFTDKGYTAQEQLDNVGLIHMNGRVYDPDIGRFTSTDPTIPNGAFSQAYGRYSYVFNNPLAMTDPTGFVPDGWYPVTNNSQYYMNNPKQAEAELAVVMAAATAPVAIASAVGEGVVLVGALGEGTLDAGGIALSEASIINNAGAAGVSLANAANAVSGTNDSQTLTNAGYYYDAQDLSGALKTDPLSEISLLGDAVSLLTDLFDSDNSAASDQQALSLGEVDVNESKFQLPTSGPIAQPIQMMSETFGVYLAPVQLYNPGYNAFGNEGVVSHMNEVDGAMDWDGVIFGGSLGGTTFFHPPTEQDSGGLTSPNKPGVGGWGEACRFLPGKHC